MYYPARGRELLHGNLMTILNWLKYSGPKTGMKAVRAMLQMQNNNELDLTKGELYSKIRKLAFDNEPECNAFQIDSNRGIALKENKRK